jgi:hypothetical protein
MPRKARKNNGRKVNKTGRSQTEGRFILLGLWLFDSPAYRSLSVVARCLYDELKRSYNGSNNGDVFLSVRDAAKKLHVGKSTASEAFKELEERGFTRLKRKGAFNLKSDARRGMASTWILTEYEHANKLATKDFMHWRGTPNDSSVRLEGQAVPTNGQTVEMASKLSLSPDTSDQ